MSYESIFDEIDDKYTGCSPDELTTILSEGLPSQGFNFIEGIINKFNLTPPFKIEILVDGVSVGNYNIKNRG